MATKFVFPWKKNIIWTYITDLTGLMPKKIVFALSLMVLVTLTEGIGLLLLVPLLQLVGLDVQQGALGQIADFIASIFTAMGIEPTLITVIIIYIAIIILNAFFYRLQTIKSFQIQYEFGAYWRKRLYRAVTNSNWPFFSRVRSSDFAHALTYEIERISSGTYSFLSLLATSMVLVVYLVFAFKISGFITLLIFIFGGILLLILRNKAQLARLRGQELSKTSKDLYSSAIQQLDGMKTIKSYNLQNRNFDFFSELTDKVAGKYVDTIQNYADVKFWFDVGAVLILSVTVVISLTFTAINTAGLLLLLYIFVRMIPNFSGIQNNYQHFINMLPAFSTVLDLEKRSERAAEPKTIHTKKIELKKEIQFQGVSFSYERDGDYQGDGDYQKNKDYHPTLENIDFIIKAGETTAIVGPSGAGKSTIADMLMGLINPEKGAVLVDNKPLSSDYIFNWRSQIGYVAQDTFLFNETISSNLQLANPEVGEPEIMESLKSASAHEFVLKLPEGLDTVVGDRGVLMSGGERQRLALARALLRKPSLLILDEATSNLDSENESRIQASIEKLHGEMTILVIAHRLSTIRKADFIYFIEKGRVVESGTWDDLIKKEHGHFRALYDAQT
jgi:ATP-binding cassette, subfamily C, bacterial